MTPQQRQRAIQILQSGQDLGPEWMSILFPPRKPDRAAGPAGFFVECPHCKREVKASRKYEDKWVRCNHCNREFLLNTKRPTVRTLAFYCECPHCRQQLRAAEKYRGQRVLCKFCAGPIQLGNVAG